ncbi:response regulator transcription factor [bacterium]|nr:response regulator transcription factor [bacterium]
MSEDKITLMIVEDQKIIRAGLKTLFDDSEDIVVIDETGSGREAVSKALLKRPNVILMDIILPDINGIKASREIREKNPDAKIIIISGDLCDKYVKDALETGVFALVYKDINSDDLMFIIRTVKDGSLWIDHRAVKIIRSNNIHLVHKTKISNSNFKAKHANLTNREYEVLKLVVDGKSNSEIAKILCISEHTAKAHVCNIIQKFLVDDRTQVAVKALREGIV